MHDFYECPYCGDDLEQWSIRFRRTGREAAAPPRREGTFDDTGGSTLLAEGDGNGEGEGLTLLSLCPGARCGYYALRYRNGLTHWDRDVEAARLLRTVFGDA